MHSRDACTAGESGQHLHALAAWRCSPFFTDRERSALALAEAITLVADTTVPDDVYQAAAVHFDEIELAHLLWTIVAINIWNWVGVATRMAPNR